MRPIQGRHRPPACPGRCQGAEVTPALRLLSLLLAAPTRTSGAAARRAPHARAQVQHDASRPASPPRPLAGRGGAPAERAEEAAERVFESGGVLLHRRPAEVVHVLAQLGDGARALELVARAAHGARARAWPVCKRKTSNKDSRKQKTRHLGSHLGAPFPAAGRHTRARQGGQWTDRPRRRTASARRGRGRAPTRAKALGWGAVARGGFRGAPAPSRMSAPALSG